MGNKKTTFLKIIGLTLILIFPFYIQAQSKIDAGIKRKKLKAFFENGASIEVLKIKYLGSKKAIGTFEDPDSIFDMHSGLVLSTGSVENILSTNTSQATSSNNNSRGYKPLNKIAKTSTKDAAVIEITFIPREEFISFNYVFGSDEYPEFVKTSFNDVFAFFLIHPNGRKVNLARIPNSKTRIAINNVNHLKNQAYYVNNSFLTGFFDIVKEDTVHIWKNNNKYKVRTVYYIAPAIDNDPKIEVQFDGFTKLLQAQSKVKPGKVYKLILCIADASDRIYDSGVLIEAGSFLSSNDKDYKYGALKFREDYYFKRDTVLVDSKDVPQLQENIVKCQPSKFELTYKTDSYTLTKQHKSEIKSFLEKLDNQFIYDISIESFTDEDGAVSHNQNLSQRRSSSVLTFIKSLELDYLNIESSEGKGIDTNFKYSKSVKRRTVINVDCTD